MVTGKGFINDFEVEVSHSYNIDELQQQWLFIQQGQSLPFFLTWSWISCWLDVYSPNLVIISARYKNQIVALGLFTCSTQIRHGFVKSRQYRLRQMKASSKILQINLRKYEMKSRFIISIRELNFTQIMYWKKQ